MDRRSFLQVLAAVGVLTGAPWWLRDPRTASALAPGIQLPTDDDVSEWLDTTDLAVQGRDTTFEFFASNLNDMRSGGWSEVRLKRFPEDGGGTILAFRLPPGSAVRWVAAPGEERRGPIRIVVPKLVQAHVIGTDALGRIVSASKDGVVPLRPYA